MPALCHFRLSGPPADLHQHANGLRALVFDWLERLPAEASEPVIRRLRRRQQEFQGECERAAHGLGHEFHDLQRLNPVTLGPMSPQPEGGFGLRLGVLVDDLIPPLVRLLHEQREIRLGNEGFRMEPPIRIEAARSFTGTSSRRPPPGPSASDLKVRRRFTTNRWTGCNLPGRTGCGRRCK
jgi:hypothetical protein